jgi:hypothetical protein
VISSARSGAVRTVGGLAVACAILLGCGSSYSPEPSKANVAESDAIRQRLEALPGVIRVDGGYVRNLEDPGSASFSIGVGPRTDLAAIADKTVEATWLSHLDPISSMGVLVGRFDDPKVGIRRHVDFRRDKAELTRRYGPRPLRR